MSNRVSRRVTWWGVDGPRHRSTPEVWIAQVGACRESARTQAGAVRVFERVV
jgi:hypothetical protein